MKKIITVDIETYSPLDITEVGAYRYAQDPAFEILLLGCISETAETPLVLDLTFISEPKRRLRENYPWLFDASYTMRPSSGGACRSIWG